MPRWRRTSTLETFFRWWAKWQKQNADAIEEMRTKHNTQLVRTPPDSTFAANYYYPEQRKPAAKAKGK